MLNYRQIIDYFINSKKKYSNKITKSIERIQIKIYLSNNLVNEQIMNLQPSKKINNVKDITKTW